MKTLAERLQTKDNYALDQLHAEVKCAIRALNTAGKIVPAEIEAIKTAVENEKFERSREVTCDDLSNMRTRLVVDFLRKNPKATETEVMEKFEMEKNHPEVIKHLTRTIQNLIHGKTERELKQFLADAIEEGDEVRIKIVRETVAQELAAMQECLN